MNLWSKIVMNIQRLIDLLNNFRSKIVITVKELFEQALLNLRIISFTSSDVFYVVGRFLYDNNRNQIVLKGINFPILDDWDFPATNNKLDELAKTNANAVRIAWYAQYPKPERPPYMISDLDQLLEKCRQLRLVPILELHDCTCQADTNLINTKLMSWWTNQMVVPILKKHERYLIINLANELGAYRWQGSTQTALDNFKNAYKTAITSIRNQGLRMPIMIDAPDCGTSLNALVQIGQELINHDSQRNILLSAHAYWGEGYNGTADVTNGVNANLPIILGEIANKQFANNDECYYGLDGTGLNHQPPTNFKYQDLLRLLTSSQVGWLAWAWYKDNCQERRITQDGTYTGSAAVIPTGLTPYGEDILYNPDYGIQTGNSPAQKASSL